MKKIFYSLILITSNLLLYSGIHIVQNKNDSGLGSLRNALINAVHGDTIRFNPTLISGGNDTIILQSEIAFDKSIVFKGLYNTNDTLFISGNDSSRIFNIDFTTSINTNKFVIFDSVMLIKGNALGNGGAISFVAGDSLTIDNSLIYANTASEKGGGIYSHFNSSVTILNTTISSNIATDSSGGGLYSTASSNSLSTASSNIAVNIYNCSIFNNIAYNGGGICLETISNASRTSYSSASSSASILINNSSIFNNTSTQFGGGIFLESISTSHNSSISKSNTVINYSNIYGNYSREGGGIHSSAFSISDVTGPINLNLAKSSVSVNNSSISNNTTLGSGGGIFSNVYSQAFQNDSSSSFITLNNSNISNNLCSGGKGGGVYSHANSGVSNSTVTVNKSTLAYDSSNMGGGIYCYSNSRSSGMGNSSVTLNKSTIYGTSRLYKGGGIYCESSFNSNVTLSNSTIYGYTAFNGGGIYCEANKNFSSYSSVSLISSIVSSTRLISSNNYKNILNVARTNNIPIISNGYNIFSDAPNGFNNNDFTFVDSATLNLLPLANNGGNNLTMLPGLGSIAIDMGNPADLTDAQNGPILNRRDIGATETGIITFIKKTPPQNNINLYPNPTSSIITIETPYITNATLFVFNSYGKLIYSSIINSRKSLVNLANNTNGLYYVKILYPNGDTVTKRVVILK